MDKNDTQNRIFVIPPGQGLNAIARDLEKDGFIRNKIVFILVVKQLGIEKNIQAGDYRLQRSLGYRSCQEPDKRKSGCLVYCNRGITK